MCSLEAVRWAQATAREDTDGDGPGSQVHLAPGSLGSAQHGAVLSLSFPSPSASGSWLTPPWFSSSGTSGIT